MTAIEDAGTGAQRRGRVGYHYRTLGWFGAISTTAAVLVAVVGGFAVFGLVASLTEDTAGLNILLAAAVAAVTTVLAVFTGVAADVVRWMHDVVDLLDEQVEVLDRLDDGAERE